MRGAAKSAADHAWGAGATLRAPLRNLKQLIWSSPSDCLIVKMPTPDAIRPTAEGETGHRGGRRAGCGGVGATLIEPTIRRRVRFPAPPLPNPASFQQKLVGCTKRCTKPAAAVRSGLRLSGSLQRQAAPGGAAHVRVLRSVRTPAMCGGGPKFNARFEPMRT